MAYRGTTLSALHLRILVRNRWADNLAADPAHRSLVREHYDRLLALEADAYTHSRPPGRGTGSTHSAAMMDEAGWSTGGDGADWPPA